MSEIEKLNRDADVARMTPEALWYDDAILHYRYYRFKASGQGYEGWTAEDMVSLHARIVQELKRRGLKHFDRGDELDGDSKPFLKDYADVRPSGNRMGDPITLDDVLPHLRTFKLRQPYVYVVGGLIVHGKTEGDVDILIKDSEALPAEFRHVLEWRIMRALPEKLWERVQFHYDHFHGPFTDNIPVFDLTVERSNEENRIFRMDADAGDLLKGVPRDEALAFLQWTQERETDAKAEAPRAGTPEVARQAEDSRREDRVELFRFFVPMKPVRGYFSEERQTLDRFLSLFGPEDFPVHSTKKYDGLNVEIHRSGDRVVVFSEDGEDDTERLPGIVEAVRKLRWRDLVLLAEVEAWRGGKHLPREAVTGYVHSKGEPDDSELVANVYDVVCAAGGPKTEGLDEDAGDVHTLPFAKREKYLEALGIAQATMDAPDPKQRLNRAPSLVSRNLDELREHTERFARAPGSEGNVAKKAAKPYSLAGRSESQVKYHNAAVLAGIVIERIPTKVAGVFNYRYAVLAGDHDPHDEAAVEIGGKTHVEVGKTFSTARKATRGQVIEVEFETLNLVRHPDGTVSVTAWAPRVMGILEDRKEPDTVDAAVAAAKAGSVFQEKEVTEDGETVYLAARPDDADAMPDEGHVEKSNYLGSKRRLAKFIVGKFPEDARTVFDPMCGVSGVLVEAARRGCRVRGNDLSIVPYWYSKGVFEGVPLSDADVEKLVGAAPHDGWLTTEWKGDYPRPRAVRRYLDGLAKLARAWQGPKGWTARGAVSAVVQTLYSESGSGYSTRRYESLEKVRAVVRRAAKEVSTLAAEVGGKGTITNEDAQSMRFPRADVVYFDPPYFKKDKGAVHYFQSYRVANSVLLGREWKEANLKPEDIPPVLERLCRSARHIFVSTSSNEVLPYAKELARHKRTMKRYRLSYRITSGFGSRDAEQHQNLFVAKAGDVEKQADPYMRLPSEDKTHRYVCQEHWRGRSMHVDLRIESVGNRDLVGWTLNTQIAGAVKEPVTTLAQAKALKSADHSKIDWDTGEFKKRRKAGAEALVDVEIVCFAGSTEIITRNGVRAISDVKAGDEVLSHDGSFRKVVRTFRTPAPRGMLHLRVMGLPSANVTANHPFLAVRAASRSHAQMSRSNRARHRETIAHDEPSWIPAGELRQGDYVLFPRPVFRPDLTPVRLETFNGYAKTLPVDEDFLRFVGFYIGDGSATNGKVRLNFNGKTEWNLAQEYVRILRRWGIDASLLQKDESHLDIEFTDKPLSKWLVAQCGSGSLRKRIPHRFLGIRGSMWSALKHGLIDSDGYVDREGRWRYCTTSKALVSAMLLQSAHVGEVMHYRKRVNAGLGSNPIYDIWFSKNQSRIVDDGQYLRRPVEAVEPFRTHGRKKRIDHVFNLEVEDMHSYCLPGASVHNCQRKAVEPHAWLGIEGVVRAGQVGATKQYPGVFCIVDKGVCEYGAQKLWVHEYFPRSDRKKSGFRYRVFFRQLRVADIKRDEEEKALTPGLLADYLAHDPDVAREDWDEGYWEFLKARGEVVLPAAETKFREEAAWLLIKPSLTPDGQTPYALSDRAVEDGWIPPKGYSALPKAVRAKVPPDLRYWQMERESERRGMRDALVKAVGAGEVKLHGVEKVASADAGEIEKRKLVPFNQWGGSAKYAKRLVKRFPEHKRYVEPFCGAAAVLFVKDRADEEMLGDLDADVVFALKYIQKLTPARFEEIKRFNWTVSRAGFKRVRECEPRSEAERFWKFVYWRLCSWGGIPRSTGFSTLHDGQTYKLDDLWKFHERLKGVRIVRRDWKETLRECDGKGTLFFIDPPYILEWGAGGKARGAAVPPEDIADGVRSLKGSFIIAYTDSARARRALSKVGRLFKMRFLEARHHGLWSKRSRLFVASSDVKKSGLLEDVGGADDIEWIEAAEGSARFVLQYHYFRKRGEKPVRAGPTTWHWDLRIDAGEKTLRHWTLDHDITHAPETVGYFKRDPDKRALEAEGFYPPGSFMNPTKDTPSFVEIVDKGECRLLVDQPALLKVEFEGKALRGVWLLEKKNSNWHVRRTETAPAAKAEEMLACSL